MLSGLRRPEKDTHLRGVEGKERSNGSENLGSLGRIGYCKRFACGARARDLSSSGGNTLAMAPVVVHSPSTTAKQAASRHRKSARGHRPVVGCASASALGLSVVVRNSGSHGICNIANSGARMATHLHATPFTCVSSFLGWNIGASDRSKTSAATLPAGKLFCTPSLVRWVIAARSNVEHLPSGRY